MYVLPLNGIIVPMTTANLLFNALQGLSMKQQRQLAKLSGVPFRTLYKIKRGFTTDPRVSTSDRLLAVLRNPPVNSSVVTDCGKSSAVPNIAEKKAMSAA